MRKAVLLLCCLVLLSSILNAKAREKAKVSINPKNFGFGLILGEPTGASFKTWLSNENAMAFAIAFGTGLKIQGDYLWHDFGVATVEEGKLPLHYGCGLKINSDSNQTKLGLRGVLGVTYIFARAPFDMFFELAPILYVAPSSSFELTGAFGFRFYIKQK